MKNISEKAWNTITIIASIAIPGVVALLMYGLPTGFLENKENLHFLPKFHAFINGTTAVLLVIGFILIRKRKIKAHKRVMLTCLSLSILFLFSYITFHSLAGSTSYGGTGALANFYYFILITHIILAAVIVPLAMLTLYRGINNLHPKHKKIAKFTLPIWFYVAVTGVIVYFMIAPYY